MSKKLEKIIGIVVFFTVLTIGVLCIDLVVGDNITYFDFNKKVLKYHTIERCLNLAKVSSGFRKKETKCSWYFRKLLMEHYISVKKSYPNNFYNSVGLFYSITNDFRYLYSLNENRVFLSIEEKEEYEKYKQMFTSELYSLLIEYRNRNISISNFIRTGSRRDSIVYRIPNRITFYPELAGLYLALVGKNLQVNNETLEHLKFLYETYNVVYLQEEQKHSRNYVTFNQTEFNKRQFNTYYPLFVIDYTRNIILLSNILHPEIEICSASDVCEKYNEMSRKLGKEVKIAY